MTTATELVGVSQVFSRPPYETLYKDPLFCEWQWHGKMIQEKRSGSGVVYPHLFCQSTKFI